MQWGTVMPSADPDHWERLRSGDPSALRALYDEHADAVFRFAFRRTASTSAAEDVTQATFTTVWRQATRGRLPRLELPTARPLLIRIASNECRNAARTHRRRRALQDRLEQTEAVTTVRDHAEEVSRRIDDERRMSLVRAALGDLPAGQREAIELVVWEGLSIAEAATALGVAEGTVKSRLSRARKRLGEMLSRPEEENR